MKFGKEGASGDGGYDDGYTACPCFWGTSPGSLVRVFLDNNPSLEGHTVLDLGCGEGKNANSFALVGASVDAVDCSEFAISNGKRAFADTHINWITASAADYLKACRPRNRDRAPPNQAFPSSPTWSSRSATLRLHWLSWTLHCLGRPASRSGLGGRAQSRSTKPALRSAAVQQRRR